MPASTRSTPNLTAPRPSAPSTISRPTSVISIQYLRAPPRRLARVRSSTTSRSARSIHRFPAGNRPLSPGQTVSDTELYMLRVNASDISSTVLESGETLCECSFLTWGYWGGEIGIAGNDDVIHLASWVAGEIPNLSAITALSGSATYSGHVSATVKEISGSYHQHLHGTRKHWDYTFNFDSPSSSTGSISVFDNGSYTHRRLDPVVGRRLRDGRHRGNRECVFREPDGRFGVRRWAAPVPSSVHLCRTAAL